jgi:hypothetical protein
VIVDGVVPQNFEGLVGLVAQVSAEEVAVAFLVEEVAEEGRLQNCHNHMGGKGKVGRIAGGNLGFVEGIVHNSPGVVAVVLVVEEHWGALQ